MDKTESLLNELSAAQFAAWETHLFLDTHSTNAKAFETLKKFGSEATRLKNEYVKANGPLTPSDLYGENDYNWLNNPWPWERSAKA